MKKQRGITLIALAITIVVLLILAGVTITTLTGDRGTINETRDTVENAERRSIIEKIQADLYSEKTKTNKEQTADDLINIIEQNGYGTVTVAPNPRDNILTSTNGYEIKFSEILGWEIPLAPGDTATSTKKNNYMDENKETATIPEDFTISKELGETTIDTGLVVIAPDGSEFVWVPVPTVISDTEANGTTNKAMAIQIGSNYRGLLYNFTSSGSTVISGCTTTTNSYREPNVVTDSSGTGYDNNTTYLNIINGILATSLDNSSDFKSQMQSEYDLMIESVKKYGGFYVGRYESSLNSENEIQSKKEVLPTSAENTNTYRWYGLYAEQKTYSTDSVQGSMIWGSQYDVMLNWALNGVDKSKVIATTNGNHNGNVVKTGTTTTDKINNIYDLEGNLFEWTLEAYIDRRVLRGSVYTATYSPSDRGYYGYDSITAGRGAGSRLTLYIK